MNGKTVKTLSVDVELCGLSPDSIVQLVMRLTVDPRIAKFLITGPSCSKLTTSLVNDSLKFTSSDTQIC